MNSELLNILLQIGVLLLSVSATWYFAKYYFKKSHKVTSLNISVHHFSDLITLEQSIKDEIKVYFKKKQINNLKLIQFLVINNGTEPIKKLNEPLKLKIPDEYKLIKSQIVQVQPEGRKIEIGEISSSNTLEINFQLLNKQEGFLIDLVIHRVDKEPNNKNKPEFIFTITAENLPPQIIVKDETLGGFINTAFYDTLKSFSKVFLYVLKFLLFYASSVGVLIILLIMLIALKIDSYNPFNFIFFFKHFDFWSLIILLSAFVSIPFLIVTIGVLTEWIKKREKLTPPFEKNYYKVFQDKLRKW